MAATSWSLLPKHIDGTGWPHAIGPIPEPPPSSSLVEQFLYTVLRCDRTKRLFEQTRHDKESKSIPIGKLLEIILALVLPWGVGDFKIGEFHKVTYRIPCEDTTVFDKNKSDGKYYMRLGHCIWCGFDTRDNGYWIQLQLG